MSVNSVLRTFGFLAGIYSAGLFVTMMSLASLQAVGFSPTASAPCDPRECTALAQHHHALPASSHGDPGFLAAAVYVAGKL